MLIKVFNFMEKIDWRSYKTWVLICVLLGVGFLVYFPHYNYDYPLHVDEWHHISQAKKLINGDYNFQSVSSFEIGYHIFLSLFQLVGLELVLVYKFFPAVFAIFSGLSLFYFVYYFTRDYWSAIFSILFFVAFESNTNILGIWFAVPLTFVLPLVFLSIVFFHKGLIEKNEKYLYWFLILFLIMLFVHAISSFFVFFVLLIYVFIAKKLERIKEMRRFFYIFFGICILAVSIFLFFNKLPLFWYFEELMFRKGWTLFEMQNQYDIYRFFGIQFAVNPYFLPLFFGIVLFIFSMIGLYFVFKNKRLKIMVSWFFYSIFMLFVFTNFKISPFVPYPRVLFLSLVGLSILGGIGLSKSFKMIERKNSVLGFIIVVLVILFLFIGYGKTIEGTEPYHLIEGNDYNAFLYLNNLEKGVVISNVNQGEVIYPIAEKDAFAGLYFLGDDTQREISGKFFEKDCEFKKEIVDSFKIKYVYSDLVLNCDFLEEVYNKDMKFIYEVV